MPIHDWTRVDAGLFHDFHQGWTIVLRNALNSDILPHGYFALVEQRIHGPIPDVLTLELPPGAGGEDADRGGTGVSTVQPRTQLVRRSESKVYAGKANRITVRHRHGKVVAVVEIVSPGNKSSRAEFKAFVEKNAALIQQGVHFAAIDLFPPGPRDPQGIHKALWDEFQEEPLDLPPGKPLTMAAYDAGPPPVAYVEFTAVGETLPDLPLFLEPEKHVTLPLERTYQANWAAFPTALKPLFEGPAP